MDFRITVSVFIPRATPSAASSSTVFFFGGISLEGNGFSTIQGNYIGTDSTGMLDRGNTNVGIVIVDSAFNVIGRTNASARNVISGNRVVGIEAFGCPGTVIAGNLIGTDRTGTNALGNGASFNPIGGVYLLRCQGSVIGGSAVGARNLISGNFSLLGTQLGLRTTAPDRSWKGTTLARM
jgi:hypothetical protein